MRIPAALVVLLVSVAVAALGRSRAAAGPLGRRQAYGRPISDWAGVSLLGLGAGLAVMTAGLPGVAWLLLAAVIALSFLTLKEVRPPNR